MNIDEDSITANAYYKKPGMDFYLVAIDMSDIGVFTNSIIVDRDRNGNLRVKPPKFVGYDKYSRQVTIQQVEFDKHKVIWKKIEQLALEAANTYVEPGEPP